MGVVLVAATAGATPRMVVDLEAQDDHRFTHGDPHCFFDAGDHVLFQAGSEAGDEVWRSDGTAAGTWLVADLAPGPAGSMPCGFVRQGDHVLFTAYDGATGRTLWRTDSTRAGTRPVSRAVTLSGGPVVLEGVAYFAGDDGASGEELWRSDGTAAGTWRVVDLAPGAAGSSPQSLTVHDGQLYFAAADGQRGRELWRWTGRAAVLVADVNPGGDANPSWLTSAGRALFFAASDGVHGRELWRADRGGARLVVDLHPGAGSEPTSLHAVGDEVFFAATDGVHGRELWRSDGRRTRLVADLAPGALDAEPQAMAAIDGVLYFAAADMLGRHPWRLEAGGAPVRLWTPGVQPADAGVRNFVRHDGGILFYGGWTSLWRTEGTPESTRRLPATPYSALFPFAGGALFAGEGADGVELWRSDGTDAGTGQVIDLFPPRPGSEPERFTATTSGVRFAARYGELYRSDGTAAGTSRLATRLGRGYARPSALLGDELVFAASGEPHDVELWATGGEGAGLVRDIFPGATGTMSWPAWMTPMNGLLYFTADDGVHGRELWRSDGTAAGTVMVADLNPGSWGIEPSMGPTYLTTAGDRLFFFTWGDDAGVELWLTDDARGPRRVADLNPGRASSRTTSNQDHEGLRPLAAAGGLFFTATDGVHGHQPWFSDGTEAGTVRLSEAASGNAANSVVFLGALGDLGCFSMRVPGSGAELWCSDGTRAGTRQVAELRPGPFGAQPIGWVELDGVALFAADDGEHGYELWRTDGSETRMVADLAPGPLHAAPGSLVALGDRGLVAFAASDGESGMELYLSDGERVWQAADLAPGLASSSPAHLTVAADRLFFAADDGVAGREPWVVELAELTGPPESAPATGGGCQVGAPTTGTPWWLAVGIAALRCRRRTSRPPP